MRQSVCFAYVCECRCVRGQAEYYQSTMYTLKCMHWSHGDGASIQWHTLKLTAQREDKQKIAKDSVCYQMPVLKQRRCSQNPVYNSFKSCCETFFKFGLSVVRPSSHSPNPRPRNLPFGSHLDLSSIAIPYAMEAIATFQMSPRYFKLWVVWYI